VVQAQRVPILRSRILVVEDEPDVAALIKHTLDRSGDVDVAIAGTGEAALKTTNDQPCRSSC
jgi:CheY-like chemotaxis protein